MAKEVSPGQVAVPLVWVGLDELPIAFANQFISQFFEGGFVLTLGQVVAPPFLGPPEQVAEQAKRLEWIGVRPLVRVSLTQDGAAH